MSQQVIALIGLSGVGKSTLLERIRSDMVFQHLQASTLIKAEREREISQAVATDSLRLADIDENQRLLVMGFKSAVDNDMSCVILDGHTLIDTPSGLSEIPSSVFSLIGVTHFVFLAESPAGIFERRLRDTNRNRPLRDEETLRAHQDQAMLVAYRCALDMRIPLTMIFGDDPTPLTGIMRARKT